MKINLQGRLYLLCMLLIPMLFTNCKKKKQEISQNPSLSFVKGMLTTDSLSANGGSVILEINWAYTRWSLNTEEQIEHAIEITELTPAYAGSVDIGPSKVKVKLTFKTNDDYLPKSRTITLKSIPEGLVESLTIHQKGKAVEPISVSLNTAITYQKISGFGGANNMWGTDFITASEMKSVFGQDDDELGLSIFRVRLSPNKTDWPLLVSTIKEAKKYGATILASPWSPPAQWKDNKSLTGGSLLEEHYQDYASYINDFVKFMSSQGAAIDVVSIQNEPDITVSYEGCHWTSDQIHQFIRENGASITGTKVMAAESFNFKQSYTDKILNDPLAVDNLDIVGGHIYGGGSAKYPLAEQKGKEIWMTEYLMNQNSGSDPANWNHSPAAIWEESLKMVETVHEAMSNNWNAYIWWYTRRYYSFLGDGEYGTTRGTILKRGYGMSHYGKFIRPGYRRIAAQVESTVSPKLKITAYKGDNKVIVVIINQESYPIHGVNFSLPQTVKSAVSYTTSVEQDRIKEILISSGQKVSINIGAKSIKTLILE